MIVVHLFQVSQEDNEQLSIVGSMHIYSKRFSTTTLRGMLLGLKDLSAEVHT